MLMKIHNRLYEKLRDKYKMSEQMAHISLEHFCDDEINTQTQVASQKVAEKERQLLLEEMRKLSVTWVYLFLLLYQ